MGRRRGGQGHGRGKRRASRRGGSVSGGGQAPLIAGLVGGGALLLVVLASLGGGDPSPAPREAARRERGAPPTWESTPVEELREDDAPTAEEAPREQPGETPEVTQTPGDGLVEDAAAVAAATAAVEERLARRDYVGALRAAASAPERMRQGLKGLVVARRDADVARYLKAARAAHAAGDQQRAGRKLKVARFFAPEAEAVEQVAVELGVAAGR